MQKNELKELISKVARDCRITIYGVNTGFTDQEWTLAVTTSRVLQKPSVAMITGDGASASDAGEIWHMFDTRFIIPVTMVTAARLSSADLTL